MATIAKLLVELGLDPSKLNQGLKNAQSSLKSFGASASRVGQKMSLFATAPIAAQFGNAISQASDLAESTSAVNTVYGEYAKTIMGINGSVAEQVGLSRQQVLQYSAVNGAILKGAGIATDSAAEMSNSMIQAGADLASFYNTDVDSALQAIKSGLTGETEPLKKYGILLNEASIQAAAMAHGISDGTTELTEQQKVQARYFAIMDGLGAAQGDFARTSDGLANKTRILKAQFQDASAELGNQLLPIMLQVVTFLSKMLKRFGQLSQKVKKWILIIGAAIAVAGPLLIVIGSIASGIAALIPVFGAIGAVIGAISLPILLIIGLVAVLGLAWYKNWFGIRDIVDRFWKFLKGLDFKHGALGDLVDIFQALAKGDFKSAFHEISNLIREVGDRLADFLEKLGFEKFAGPLRQMFNLFSQLFRQIVTLVDDIVHGRWNQIWGDLYNIAITFIQLFWTYLQLLPSLIVDVFNMIPWADIGNALLNGFLSAASFLIGTGIPWLINQIWTLLTSDSLYNAAYSAGNFLIDGLAKGISFAWGWMWGWFQKLPGYLVDAFAGIWGFFFNIGWSIISGLIAGIASLWDSFSGWVGSIVDKVVSIKDALGVNSPSKITQSYGASIIEGFTVGIAKAMPQLDRAIGSITATVTAEPQGLQGLQPGAGRAVTNNLNIAPGAIVASGGDSEEVADKVVKRLMVSFDRVTSGV